MTLLSIIAAVSIISTGVAGGTPGDAKMASPIRILSSSHDVNFPKDVVFSLEAESDWPITEVRLFYSLENRPVQVYGYPDFVPDNRVTVEFSVKTDGSSYIPTGIDIEYFYRITDSGGNTLETDRFSFAYRDPRYTWRELTRGDLTVLFHNLTQDSVERVVDDVVGQLEAVRDMFGVTEFVPMKAVIVNGTLEARRAFPFTSNAATNSHLYGGFAFGEYGLFVMQGLSADTMVHEATHLLLDSAIDSPLARVPAWLNEGLSTYFEESGSRRGVTVSRAERSNDLLRLKSMGSQPGRPRDIGIFYAQAWSTVNFMIAAYGPEKMSELISTINDGNRIDAALTKTYGVTVDELEQLWKADLRGQPVVLPRPDIGSVATAAMITGAVAIAVVASTWRWLMRWLRGPQPEEDAASAE
jgi:hypothetical protein